MKKPFKGGYKVTQYFGENPDTYKEYGFEGHEGLDIIPLDSDWDIYAVEGGVVVRDVDAPRDFDNYGNLIVIWNMDNNRGWWYAHNSDNVINIGDEIEVGQKIARMGSTGNSTGAHCHLGVRKTDDSGYATDLNNGYKGFVNPLPILEKVNQEIEENWQDLAIKYKGERDNLSKLYKDYQEACEEKEKSSKRHIEELQNTISKFNDIANMLTLLESSMTKWGSSIDRVEKLITDDSVALRQSLGVATTSLEKVSKKNSELEEKVKGKLEKFSKWELFKAWVGR